MAPRHAAAVGALLASAVVVGACGWTVAGPDAVATPTQASAPAEAPAPSPEATSQAARRPAPSTDPERPAYTDGAVELVIVDGHGRGRGGVPVRMVSEAGEERTLVSGPDGRVLTSVPPAFYELAVVAGCTDTIEVLGGGTASIAIPPGEVVGGELRVDWRQRFVPARPTDWIATDDGDDEIDPPMWRANVVYEVVFAMVDRCDDNRIAPSASYETYRFEQSPNVGITDAGGLVADADGRGHVRAFCDDRGVVELSMYDAANPSEPPFDLLVFAEHVDGRPFCDA